MTIRLSSLKANVAGHSRLQESALYKSFLVLCVSAGVMLLLGCSVQYRSIPDRHHHDRALLQLSSNRNPQRDAGQGSTGTKTKRSEGDDEAGIALELFSLTFDYLLQYAMEYKEKYATASPFPHIALDGLFPERFLDKVVGELPEDLMMDDGCLSQERCRTNDEEIKKSFIREEDMMGPYTKMLLGFMSSATFIEFLEVMTGINNLMSDPKRIGSGVHFIGPGGKLGIHADFNKHEDIGLWRRVNTFIYLNPDWKPEYGGDLELWSRDMKSCMAAIPPVLGRFVIFTTTDFSYHGHPSPLTAPPGRARRSIAMYYYTRNRPNEACLNPDDCDDDHGTLFQDPEGCAQCSDEACMRYDPNQKQAIDAVKAKEGFHPPHRINPSGNGPEYIKK